MGRGHSFHDSQFRPGSYEPTDAGEYTEGLVSVSMPFKGQHWDAVYAVIKEECQILGLHPERVDEYAHSGVVVRDITELIDRAEFLIFDLSLERQNVYYELGYAHGVGNEASDILLIAQEGTELHYDIAGLRVHFYTSLDHFRGILSTCLAEMIRVSRR